MKKLAISILALALTFAMAMGQNVKLEVGKNAPDWKLPDADGKMLSMTSWSGKVLQVNYVDPDESDLNDALTMQSKRPKTLTSASVRILLKALGLSTANRHGSPTC